MSSPVRMALLRRAKAITPVVEPEVVADAEESVLSAMLMDKAAVAEVRALDLRAADFANPDRANVFRALLRLDERGSAIDPLTLSAELNGTLESLGGKDYIAWLVDVVPTSANVRSHAKLVLNDAKGRALADKLEENARALKDRTAKPDEVATRLRPALDAITASPDADRRFRLYSIADLASLPKHEDLIAGVLPGNALVGLIGGKGTMKTMVGLDIGLHIALGIDWQGRKVRQGGVCYVYAEGPSGAEQRVNAWVQYYEYLGFTIDRSSLPIWFLPGSIAINDTASISELLGEIRKLPVPITFLVADTLNRNLDGKEDDEGMGDFVSGCANIQAQLGATVMPVHHTPLSDTDRGRGHGSFDGALDTRLMVTRDDDRITVECTHQRNGIDGWSVAFEAIPMAGSIVLKPSALDGGELKGQRRQVLDLLHQKGTATYTSLLRDSGLNASSFRKARSWLLTRSYVRVENAKYQVTEAGQLALRAPRAPEGHNE